MKKITLVLIFVAGMVNARAQEPFKFNDLVEVNSNGPIKFYLDGVFKISYEYCSNYYMIAELDRQYFQVKDTFKIYYRSDELFLEGGFKKGELDGKFTWYHKNGQIQIAGEYTSGKRSGVWEFFYANGNPYKKIEYKNNREYLIDFFGQWGKVMVKDGNGFFDDNVYMSAINSAASNIKGDVVNGLPEGKWKIYILETKVGTEYFENNSFVKGVSHSVVLGDKVYRNESISTFTGIIHIEQLQLFGPSMCKNKMSLGLTRGFYSNLKLRYDSSGLKNVIANNWFLVELKADGTGNIVDVHIFSHAKQEFTDELKKIIMEMKKVNTVFTIGKTGYEFFLFMVFDNEFYLPTG